MSYTRGESLGPCRVGEPCPAPLRVAMRSPLPFPCVPDRPYKILLAQVGTLSFSHPLFGVSVLFIYLLLAVLPQRQKAHSACCEATPTCGIKVHSLPQRATRCSRAAGSWHDPIRVECTRCSATGAALMRAVLACSRCAPKARHRQGHKPGPQRDCGPGMVASSMACDHGERTFSDRLRSPTPTWLTGPTKQLYRAAPVATRRQ